MRAARVSGQPHERGADGIRASLMEKARFLVVGSANTVIDFGLYAVLNLTGLAPVLSNLVSTTVAFVFSFFANRSFTFHSAGSRFGQMVRFAIVTLSGLWGLQSLVILGIERRQPEHADEPALQLTAKVLATIVTLVWNYVWYSRWVFRDGPGPAEDAEDEVAEPNRRLTPVEPASAGPASRASARTADPNERRREPRP